MVLGLAGVVHAEGDEDIGPLKQGFLKPGNCVLAGGTGLELRQPGTITIDLPAGLRVEQVLLYWGLRSSRGDNVVRLNNSVNVTGELIGTSTPFPGADTRPFVYRADITHLDLIKTGENRIAVKDLTIRDTGFVNGAEIVVIASDGSASTFEARDGCDFAYWRFVPPVQQTNRQRFSFEATASARSGELVLVVGDHKSIDQGAMRPSTLEVAVDGAPLQVINDPLKGADGDSWDTVIVPVTLPSGARSVDVQLFSDTRTGSKLSPSSFYWVWASLKIQRERTPQNLSISGTVYCDTNGNSAIDGGEMGLAGVDVSLSCVRGGETIKRSTITDANGKYAFGDIPPGSNCTVSVVPGQPALQGKEPTEVCPPISNLQASVTDCDFGFALPPKVGDTVFFDINGDGAQQPGEPGLAGVKATVVAPAGGGFPGYSSSAVTDNDGKYLFLIPGVPGGATLVATVTIDPQTGDARGKTLTTPNPQQSIPLGPGGMDLTLDFGLTAGLGDARVGDTVFHDDDGDGRLDDGEQGLANVKVSITCPAGNGFAGFTSSTTTDSQGKYGFVIPGIPTGREVVCTVSIDPTTGEAQGKQLTTPNPQNTVPLGPGEADLDRDFGLKPGAGDALVGDTVYCDLNGNGRQDAGEPGIRDVPVSLTAPASGGFPETNLTTRTDADGKYLFTLAGIPFGASVTATVSIDANAPAAQDKVLTTPNPQTTAPLTPGAADRDRDFGLKPRAARVGDTVFCDTNGDGILDPGEPGIAGVKVTLSVPPTGAFGGHSNSTTTDAQGKYLFTIEGIPPDTRVVATVEVDPTTGGAAGFSLTTPNPQRTVELGAAGQDLNRDFGFLCDGVKVKLCLEHKTAAAGECVDVRALLSTNRPVEGFVTAVRHDPSIVRLDSITTDNTATQTNLADFESFEVLPNGGTAGVVMDLQPPFNGNTIPAGTDIPIVVYRYCCPESASTEPRTSALELVDGVLGNPPKENAVVIGGQSIAPELCPGSVTCRPPDGPCVGPYFLCGGPELGPDQKPVPIRGAPGGTVELCFYYCSPEDNKPGHAQYDHLQALSMAVTYDCRLTCIEGSFRTPPDTMTDALDAEFISFQCENDPNDGDGCELILAILVDALEPFDGRTFPPTEIPLKLGCVDMRIGDGIACGTCLPVRFTDGINGRGRVRVKNVYAAENESFRACTEDCEICVTGAEGFRRGDCNGDARVNLPDAASILSKLFPMGSNGYEPPCLDACDSNDDGRLDIADAVRILAWLFQRGAPPLAPGPTTPGQDPTPDKLTCDAPGGCL